MRNDLAFAYASLDWATAQLPSFQDRTKAWLDENLDYRWQDIEGHPADYMLVAFEKKAFPLSFSVEVGSYINAIRSALDILAVALANRYGISDLHDVYFPIVASKTAFKIGKYKASGFMKQLPEADRSLIEGLQPYKGGNDLLWILHQLDITRKHRRLLEVNIKSPSFTLFGWGVDLSDFQPVQAVVGANGEFALGFLPKQSPKPQVKLAPEIFIEEPDIGFHQSADIAFLRFVAVVRSIIQLFE